MRLFLILIRQKKNDNINNVWFERVVGETGLAAPLDKKEWDELVTRYYQLRGWDPGNGRPMKAKLEDLGMKNVADGMG